MTLRIAATVAAILSAALIFGVVYLFVRFSDEAAQRRDQTCKLFEGDHLADVKKLRNTYRYVKALRPGERDDTINVFIVQGLSDVEREARVDSAPDYCDEPGVGLKEPDPVIPKRPKFLK